MASAGFGLRHNRLYEPVKTSRNILAHMLDR
jgi:hypothetical protein